MTPRFWKRACCTALVLLCAGCSILALPFQLIGSILKLVFGLFEALINVGSSAAMGAAKFAPLAMLFAQADPVTPPTDLLEEQTLDRLALAMESAPQEILTRAEATEVGKRLESGNDALTLVVIDPVSLLTEEGRSRARASLQGRSIVSARWIAVGEGSSASEGATSPR